MVSFPAKAQEESASATEAEEVVPLLKMKKPELKIVYKKQSDTTIEDTDFEDEVIATGVQKVRDPIICKELTVPDVGKFSNGSRLRKKQTYCNRRSRWDVRQRKTLQIVKDATRM